MALTKVHTASIVSFAAAAAIPGYYKLTGLALVTAAKTTAIAFGALGVLLLFIGLYLNTRSTPVATPSPTTTDTSEEDQVGTSTASGFTPGAPRHTPLTQLRTPDHTGSATLTRTPPSGTSVASVTPASPAMPSPAGASPTFESNPSRLSHDGSSLRKDISANSSPARESSTSASVASSLQVSPVSTAPSAASSPIPTIVNPTASSIQSPEPGAAISTNPSLTQPLSSIPESPAVSVRPPSNITTGLDAVPATPIAPMTELNAAPTTPTAHQTPPASSLSSGLSPGAPILPPKKNKTPSSSPHSSPSGATATSASTLRASEITLKPSASATSTDSSALESPFLPLAASSNTSEALSVPEAPSAPDAPVAPADLEKPAPWKREKQQKVTADLKSNTAAAKAPLKNSASGNIVAEIAAAAAKRSAAAAAKASTHSPTTTTTSAAGSQVKKSTITASDEASASATNTASTNQQTKKRIIKRNRK